MTSLQENEKIKAKDEKGKKKKEEINGEQEAKKRRIGSHLLHSELKACAHRNQVGEEKKSMTLSFSFSLFSLSYNLFFVFFFPFFCQSLSGERGGGNR